jgi:DNA-binding transcriptional LysR family regulator
VSRQVAALEARLGVRLLHRTTRQVSPTEAGAELYGRAVAAMRTLAEAEDDVRAGESATAGVVRVAVPGLLGRRLVVPMVRDLLLTFPELSIELQCTDQVVSLVEGRVDFAVRIGPQSEAALLVRRLGVSPQRFVAARSYARAHGLPATRAELGRHTLVGRSGGGPIAQLFAEARQGGARIAFSADDLDVVYQAVREGLGVGLLPAWLVADELTRRGPLVACPIDMSAASGPVSLVRKRRRLAAATRPPRLRRVGGRSHRAARAVGGARGRPGPARARAAELSCGRQPAAGRGRHLGWACGTPLCVAPEAQRPRGAPPLDDPRVTWDEARTIAAGGVRAYLEARAEAPSTWRRSTRRVTASVG